jgi:DNA-binding CsgD family transcriptional regulator
LTKEKAFELEKFIISEIGLENLTNIHEGGNGGIKKNALKKIIGESNEMSQISNQEAAEIKWLVNNTKMLLKEVANKYSTSLSLISHIRGSRTWRHVEETKPNWYNGKKKKRLTPNEKKRKRKKRASEVKWLVNNTEIKYKDIANQYNVHENTIKRDVWNRSEKVKSSKPNWYEGPIIDLETKKQKKKQKIAEIKWLKENTYMYDKEIAERYNVKYHRISDLANNRVKKHINTKKPEWYNKNIETEKEKKLREIGEIKWLAQNSDLNYKEIAKRYNISEATVGNIKREDTRKNVSPRKPK